MLEEKKTVKTEEVKEEARKLTEEELAQVTGGARATQESGGLRQQTEVYHELRDRPAY